MHTWSRGSEILNNAYGTLNKVSVDETINIFTNLAKKNYLFEKASNMSDINPLKGPTLTLYEFQSTSSHNKGRMLGALKIT